MIIILVVLIFYNTYSKKYLNKLIAQYNLILEANSKLFSSKLSVHSQFKRI